MRTLIELKQQNLVKIFLYTTFLILFVSATQNIVSGQSSYGTSFGVVIGNDGNVLKKYKNDVRTFRNGYQVGLKANFGTYSFYISPGIFYKSVTIDTSFTKIEPFVKSPSLKIGKAKVVIGYQTNLFTKKIKFKLGGGLNGNYVLSISDNNQDYDFVNITDKYLAYNVDIGLDVFFLNFNISYEKSLKDVFVGTPNHKFDFIVLSAGVLF